MTFVISREIGGTEGGHATPRERTALDGYTGIDPAAAEAVAQLIARHARSLDDGEMLADILGLDEGVRTWNSDYNRIMRLADSIGGPR